MGRGSTISCFSLHSKVSTVMLTLAVLYAAPLIPQKGKKIIVLLYQGNFAYDRAAKLYLVLPVLIQMRDDSATQ